MTIQITYFGAPEVSDTVALSTTAKTVIVQGDEFRRTYAGAQIINTSGSAVTVSLYRRDGVTDDRFWRGVIPANDTVSLDRPFIPLVTDTQSIAAEASTGGSIEIWPVVTLQIINAPTA